MTPFEILTPTALEDARACLWKRVARRRFSREAPICSAR